MVQLIGKKGDMARPATLWGEMPGFGSGQLNIIVPPFLAVILALGFVPFSKARLQAVSTLPQLTVWAWQRDEDLSYIDPAKIKVAYFAGNIYVRGSYVNFRPRTQKLKLPAGAQTIPVFRIDTVRSHKGAASEPTLEAANFAAKTIANQMRKLNEIQMVQIDFDALEDERSFYKSLLRNLRRELRGPTKISITALTSWLLSDRWLERGSADEVVAMLFSIGPGRRDVLTRLKSQSLDSGAGIAVAIAISASEKATNQCLFKTNLQRNTASLYIFNSHPWTENRLRAITKEALAR